MANIFPVWTNQLPLRIIIGLVLIGTALTAFAAYYFTPAYSRVGYQPEQPVPFSHYLHSGQLGIDCRYCHTGVAISAHSNVPDTQTCMSCHKHIQTNSPVLEPVRQSYESGEPIEWVRIHKVPDYVYFNHAAHVNRGISCVECHGRVDQMEVVHHAESFSMGWCLECHRNPEDFIRPNEHVYDLAWEPASKEEQVRMGAELVHDNNVLPPQSCSGCHR